MIRLFYILLFVISPAVITAQVNVAILGDSNTWIGGDDCSKPEGWNKWFKDSFKPASCRSYARSGATWTNTAATKCNTMEDISVLGDDNVIYNQVCRLEEACKSGRQVTPDVIIVACGTNDAWFSNKRPGIYEKTQSQAFATTTEVLLQKSASEIMSLAESVRYCCERLRHDFPGVRLILLTPMQSVHAGQAGIKKVGDIIESCGKQMTVPVVRQDVVCCVRYAEEKTSRRYTSDGTHTNALGAEKNGNILAREIRKLVY